jgi:hypothetical protein
LRAERSAGRERIERIEQRARRLVVRFLGDKFAAEGAREDRAPKRLGLATGAVDFSFQRIRRRQSMFHLCHDRSLVIDRGKRNLKRSQCRKVEVVLPRGRRRLRLDCGAGVRRRQSDHCESGVQPSRIGPRPDEVRGEGHPLGSVD